MQAVRPVMAVGGTRYDIMWGVSAEYSVVGRITVSDSGMWTLPYQSIDIGVIILLRV